MWANVLALDNPCAADLACFKAEAKVAQAGGFLSNFELLCLANPLATSMDDEVIRILERSNDLVFGARLAFKRLCAYSRALFGIDEFSYLFQKGVVAQYYTCERLPEPASCA